MLVEQDLAHAIEAFRELEARHHSPPRGRAALDRVQRDAFTRAHVELYQLAQLIASRVEPEVQATLLATRRRVVVHITAPEARQIALGAHAALRPAKLHRPIRWDEIMLTP